MSTSSSLNHFLRHSLIFTVSSIFVNLLGYLFHILAARFLGPSNYSEITTVFAYGTILSIPILAVSVIIIGQSGGHPDESTKIRYLNSLRSYFDSLARSYPLLLTAYLILSILGYLNHLTLASAIIMPAFVLTFLFAQLYPILLQSVKRFTSLSLVITIWGILKLAAALVAPIFPSAPLVLLLLVIVNLVQIWLARAALPSDSFEVAPLSSARIFRDPRLKLTFFSLLGLIVINNFDLVIAKQLLPADITGMYGVWSLFAKAITYSFLPLSSVALVFFSDQNERRHTFRILITSLVFLGIAGIIAFFAFGYLSNLMITKLMGSAFSPLVPLLPLSAVFGTLYSMIYLVNNYYLSKNSSMAIIPTVIAAITLLTLSILGTTLVKFTNLITLSIGLSLFLYPMTMYLRTKLSFSRPSL